MSPIDTDVLIIGAGLSGVCAACHLEQSCPSLRYQIIEARAQMGGTWDLFRYPGVRSDSDMHTLGFSFRPWTERKVLADGPSIRRYIQETAEAFGITRHIRFQQRVTHLSWSSEQSIWTVTVQTPSGTAHYRARFVMTCAGYYRYDKGYTPDFDGIEDFTGRVIHPQHWPEDLDYSGKRVVVIGSGATAVTLVPAMAKKAQHVTMLQRSPTYIFSVPESEADGGLLRRLLPPQLSARVSRWRNALLHLFFYETTQQFPDQTGRYLIKQVQQALGPDYDVKTHFTPRYRPWEQRLCAVPDGDLFHAIRDGSASVVTGHIDRFTPSGIQLTTGEEVEADIIITATGLQLQFLGGATLEVDGVRPRVTESMTYKGMMLSDVPNLMFAIGYTNASWTLKVDLTCAYFCRLLNHMASRGYSSCVPRVDEHAKPAPLLNLKSGYIDRATHLLPRGGDRAPWRMYQNYVLDTLMLRYSRLEDGTMEFHRGRVARATPVAMTS